MLIGNTVSLEEMLSCRERRAACQQTFLSKYHCPVISFCLNIPGPVKTNPELLKVFKIGKEEIIAFLQHMQIPVVGLVVFNDNTGDEFIACVDGPSQTIKQKTTMIEESHPLGRLFDIDVIDVNGEKLSRNGYRKCLICDQQAQECARARRHTVEEMQSCIVQYISKGKK
ncbi:MAG: citrate lyase holo-[acyl-carrier protein] synthase [Lachnospiraceae bacterium]